ncbi:FAD-dependent oxidoreductase [Bifidobacterium sp.]|jgi:dihydrolipoamide dehydrogenase|uniref:FAD-dependent oxidoreductase n=1 Tax=Bifidobacterium sp. TaxID=41200 RepID=UPI0025B9B636|nr:FAD-dependent oxidoreductase [Bifidobacterium sp.]MCH4209198.1 FAD-dependent oxidoreductase [Bifidobacterium sp.]MCI1224691.1 FAD-dependent oxidoreductase [Bifidobacterium sp.]
MGQQFDIAVIGSGPGGYSAALRAAQLGKSVALIEHDSTLGGTCLNRGCIPSKALITAARTMDTIHEASEVGINATINSVDFGAMNAYKTRIVETMTSGLAGLLAHRGVMVFQGEAQISNAREHTVTVTPHRSDQPGASVRRFNRSGVGDDLGPSFEIEAADIILAIGSQPQPLPQHDFSGALIDSTQALSLGRVPASAVIIGAGAVAVEFASMWKTSGCDVTLLIRKDRVLSTWDRRAGATLTRELKRRGINVVTHANVTSVDVGVNLGATVHYTREDQTADFTAFGEVALAAIGRYPATGAPWVSDSGIELTDAGFVTTDGYGRTNIPGIWAVGDITEGESLANRAFEQGIVVAESIAGLDPRPVNDDTVPKVVFCTPEAASVGCTAEQARARGDLTDIEETVFPMMSNARMLMSRSSGSLAIVSGEILASAGSSDNSNGPENRDDSQDAPDQSESSSPKEPDNANGPDSSADAQGTKVVLGVHIVAPDASDLIAEAEQLVGNRVPLSEAARLIHPHPTFSETIGEALLKADGRPLHTR